MKKQFLALLIVSLLVMSLSICFAASKFPDTVNTKYDAAAEYLSNKGVIKGYPDGTFQPNNPVTRAEMCVMVVNGLGLKKTTDLPMLKFSDINLQDKKHWGYDWIKILSENSLITGYPDGTFGPDNNITYAEVMVILVRGMGLESKMTDKSWPTGWMNEASKQGLLTNVNYSNPNAPAARGEIAVSVYNMVTKLEKQRLEEELAKKEAEKKAQEDAKKNELDFDIVSTTSVSKSTYYLKMYGDTKTKYEINSIKGSTKLTDSKVEDLKETVIGYKEDKDDLLDIPVYYTTSSFDKAKIITKVDGNKITFKDKDVWDLGSTTFTDKYKYYTFIRITADVDSKNEDEIYFDTVKKIGLGFTNAKLAKAERILVDTSNNIVVILKGIPSSAVIKKGRIASDSEDTSDYLYGWVTSTRTKSKTDYAKIGKTEYEVYSKSKDFVEDTFVVYEIKDEGEEYDLITLVKSYDAQDLDSGASIVSSVSGKAGSQKVTMGSTTLDFSNTKTVDKYEDYNVVTVEISVNKSTSKVVVDDYTIERDVEDLEFSKGDRVVIDTAKEVFIVYTGLEYGSKVTDGKYMSAAEVEAEANKEFTVSYAWGSTGSVEGVSLPASVKVKNGNSYTPNISSMSKDGYTFKADKTAAFKVTANTTIKVTWTYSDPEKAKLEKAVADTSKAYDDAVNTRIEAYKTAEAKSDAKKEADNAVKVCELAYTQANEENSSAQSKYATIKDDPNKTDEEKAAAKEEADLAAENVGTTKDALDKALAAQTKAANELKAAEDACKTADQNEVKAKEAKEAAADALADYVANH